MSKMLLPVSLQPGIYTETSDRANLNRYKAGSNVNFWKGNAQKIGGWQFQIAQAFFGVCRSIVSWTTLSYQSLIGLGTDCKLYLADVANIYDITPIDSTGTLPANPITTINLSNVVAIQDTAHGRSVGDFVEFSGAPTYNGVNINSQWRVNTVIDVNNYTFLYPSNATGSGTGGGAGIAVTRFLPSGQKDSVLGSGWGAGGYGTGTWGTARTSAVLTLARIWSLALWGEDLLASPLDGAIYVWVASTGTGANATLIATAPAQNRKIFVSDQLRIVVSFGSHDGSSPQPMLIRWSDSEDYTDWTPSPTNLSGDEQLDGGNQIITAIQTNTDIAVITDTRLWSMTMTGDDLVFAFIAKGDISGLLSPNACVEVNGTVYGMGYGSFWTYNGTIGEILCDVHTAVFGTPQSPKINLTQAAKVYAARNKLKKEIIFFYCSAASTEIDSCVGLNYEDNSWWLGGMARTAWLDTSPLFQVPVALGPTQASNQDLNAEDAAGIDSTIYVQETGVDAGEVAGTVGLPYFIETYDMEISATNNLITGVITGAGQYVAKVSRIFPDFTRLVGTHLATFKARKYPNSLRQIVKGPKPFYPGKPRVDMHVRGRQLSVRIEGSQVGSDIAMGVWRIDSAIEGEN